MNSPELTSETNFVHFDVKMDLDISSERTQMGSCMLRHFAMLFLALITVLTPLTAAWAGEEEAETEDEGGSSLEEGPPVRSLLMLRKNRLEIQPTIGFSVNDPFVRNMTVGVTGNYFFTNNLGLSFSAGYGVLHVDTDEINAVTSENFSNQNVKRQLNITELTFASDAGIVWTPIFGKVAFLGNILNYDVHVFGGAGGLQFAARCADETNPSCREYGSLGGFTIAGALGIGTRLYFNNYLALNIDLKDYLLSRSEYSRSADEDNSEFGQYFMTSIGLSIFFPSEAYLSQ